MRANERDRGAPRNIECLVHFLDNTQQTFIIDRRSKGQCLLDEVFKHLDLIETDIFGLKYIPREIADQCLQNNDSASSILLTKTQSLNSYDQSPSSNASLSSSSTTNAPVNHQNSSADFPTVISANSVTNSITPTTSVARTVIANNARCNNILTNNNNNNNNSFNHNYNLHQLQTGEENNTSTFIEERWLDPTKSIRKQYKTGPPFKFYFRVKFYISDPCRHLIDHTTRYHIYLQLRQDIWNNRLFMPCEGTAVSLASYILQSEVGDYKEELLEKNYANKYRLLPIQTDDFNKKVIKEHRDRHKSLSSAVAKYDFLQVAKNLDCYGVKLYGARDLSKATVQIGVSSNGIVVFRYNEKISQFSWAKIIKIMFKKKIFSIQLRRDEGENCDNLLEYNLITNQACKSFWEECVAQHSFFRLHQPKNPPKKFFSFLNFGSKFQYSGKTEYQTMEESALRKRSSHFSRTPSKRYARRTIPIGRPSWSVDQDNKANDTNCQHVTEHNQFSTGVESNLDRDRDVADSSWIASSLVASSSAVPKQSVGPHLTNGSLDPKSSAYRPKSLTLKSFIYIDESKNFAAHEQPNTIIEDNVTDNSNCIVHKTHDNHNLGASNVFKKDLKRGESLRISNSLKGAISLTKKAGLTSGNQLARISETLRDKFLVGKSKKSKQKHENLSEVSDDSIDLDTTSETSMKVVRILPDDQGKYGFKIKESAIDNQSYESSRKRKGKVIIVHSVSCNSPAATCDPRLYEGDQLITINGKSIDGLNESKVASIIKSIQSQDPPELILEVNQKYNIECANNRVDPSGNPAESNSQSSPVSMLSNSRKFQTLAESIRDIKSGLESKNLIKDFEKLPRKKEDEQLEESTSKENVDKNRYQDILPYDSTRVKLDDSMTGDYINASFVDMTVPSGVTNKYIATQGPLQSTCEDFWQMVWEQNCSLIIMVTPLIEAGRVKCHKYWPEEKEDTRYGQLIIRCLSEKSKTATINRTIQLYDPKVSIESN